MKGEDTHCGEGGQQAGTSHESRRQNCRRGGTAGYFGLAKIYEDFLQTDLEFHSPGGKLPGANCKPTEKRGLVSLIIA